MGKSPVLSGGTHLHNLSWREERISQIAILHCTTLQEGTPVPCSVGIHCDIRLLLPLGKCDILLVPGLTDQLWGQAPSHFLGGLSATYILPLATLWLWHVGTFHEGSQASEGFPDSTWDTHPGRDPTQPFALPHNRRFLLAPLYVGPHGFSPSYYCIAI